MYTKPFEKKEEEVKNVDEQGRCIRFNNKK